LNRLKRYFLYGLTIFLPFLLTVYIIIIVFNFADGFLGKFIKPLFINLFGFYPWGISIVISALLILVAGFLATHFFGKDLYPAIERLLLRLPFFREVYPSTKQLASFLFSRDKKTFKQVVLVEYPRKGIYSIGFIVSDPSKVICEKVGRELCNILIPGSPSPFSGFVIMVPQEEVIFLDIPIEDAIKFIVSDGVVSPQ